MKIMHNIFLKLYKVSWQYMFDFDLPVSTAYYQPFSMAQQIRNTLSISSTFKAFTE